MALAHRREHGRALVVAVLAQRVEVEPHAAREQHRVLRHQRDARAEGLLVDAREVDAVDEDAAALPRVRGRVGRDGREQRECERALARAGAPDDGGAGAALDGEGQVVQRGRQVRRVADGDVLEDDVAGAEGPRRGRRERAARLVLNVQHLDEALHARKVHLELPVLLAQRVRGLDELRGGDEHERREAGGDVGVERDECQDQDGDGG